MGAIIEDGYYWRDIPSDVWSAYVDIFGKKMMAYAVEMRAEGDIFVPDWDYEPHDESVSLLLWNTWRSMNESRFPNADDIVMIGGMPCIVVIAS